MCGRSENSFLKRSSSAMVGMSDRGSLWLVQQRRTSATLRSSELLTATDLCTGWSLVRVGKPRHAVRAMALLR